MKIRSGLVAISLLVLCGSSAVANNSGAVAVVTEFCDEMIDHSDNMSRNASFLFRGAVKLIAPSYLEKHSLNPEQCSVDSYAFSKYAILSSNPAAIKVKCINEENFWAVDLTFETVAENGKWYIVPTAHEARPISVLGPAHISITPWISANRDVSIDIPPDWNAMYKEAAGRLHSSFVPKNNGDTVTIYLLSGRSYTGTIDAVRANEADFSLPVGKMTISRASIAEQTRVMLWADDYAKIAAKQEVLKAQAAFKRKTADDIKRHKESASRKTAQYYKDNTKLVLLDWSWHTEHGYAIAEGMVKNVSSEPLRNICANVTFLTASGSHVTSEDSLVSYNPIMPNQASPFRVMARENPEIRKARIDFKQLMGGTVDHLTEENYNKLVSGEK